MPTLRLLALLALRWPSAPASAPLESMSSGENGDACEKDAQCRSGHCFLMVCVKTYPLPDDEDCLRHEDCAGGYCVGNQVGGRCHHRDHGVLGTGQLCAFDRQCRRENCRSYLCSDLGDLAIGDWCEDDMQCSSGKCMTNRCSGAEDGASCSGASDCASKRCINGECIAAGAWEQCSSNGDCNQDAFCMHGFCQTLPGGCEEDSQCSSGRCVHGICGAEASSEGDFCGLAADCPDGVCIVGACRSHANLSLGGTCTENWHCHSGHCVGFRCSMEAERVLALGQFCQRDLDCASGHCVELQCRNSSVLDNGELCMRHSQCASGHCIGALCRARASRVLELGEVCLEADECLTGACVGFRCARAAAGDLRAGAFSDAQAPLPGSGVLLAVAAAGCCLCVLLRPQRWNAASLSMRLERLGQRLQGMAVSARTVPIRPGTDGFLASRPNVSHDVVSEDDDPESSVRGPLLGAAE